MNPGSAPPTFDREVDRVIAELRALLLREVEARAAGRACAGGIRSAWNYHVRRLAVARRNNSTS